VFSGKLQAQTGTNATGSSANLTLRSALCQHVGLRREARDVGLSWHPHAESPCAIERSALSATGLVHFVEALYDRALAADALGPYGSGACWEGLMRAVLAICALLAGLLISGPGRAQGTSPSAVAPKQQSAPVGHRQPRPSSPPDNPAVSNPPPAPPPAASTGSQDMLDPDGRLNRILNSICRGC